MNKHILIIDDEEVIRDLLARCLANRSYRITAVATAAEAIRVVEREAPDLVISDLQLEDADGLEMIAEIKRIVPAVPVILLTGVLFDPQVVKEILRQHVSRYLKKTAPLAQILETVQELLPDSGPEGAS
jgi:DNA-binding NtrC family response regulator